MTSAAYFRLWRAAHPEYRERQRRLRAERRRRDGRGDRSAEYAKRASRAIPPLPELHTGHPILDRARELVPSRSTLTTLRDPLVDDLRSVAVVALLEGGDPTEAVRQYRAIEHRWGRLTAPLFDWGAAA